MLGIIFSLIFFILSFLTTLVPLFLAGFVIYKFIHPNLRDQRGNSMVGKKINEDIKLNKEKLEPQVLISETRKREARRSIGDYDPYDELDEEYENRYEEDCGCRTCDEILEEKKKENLTKKEIERNLRRQKERKERDNRINKEILIKKDGEVPAEELREYTPIKEDCKCIAYKKLDLRSAIIYKEILGEPLSKKHNRR